MYLDHYKMNELPFRLTPSTQYFVQMPTHAQALDVLLVGLRSGEGFIKIVGEVGTGKTLLCRKLLRSLPEQYKTAYIFNPILTPEGLYHALADELQLSLPAHISLHQLMQLIMHKLIEFHEQGKQVVLLLDEAQALSEETLEALRLITNLETESEKLLQVIFFGQPELDILLNKPSLRQTKQRITFSYYLGVLSHEEIREYLQFRLYTAGYRGPFLFSNAALGLIVNASRGVPRLINTLAHKSLLAAFGRGDYGVRRLDVYRALIDTEGVISGMGSIWYKLTTRIMSLTT